MGKRDNMKDKYICCHRSAHYDFYCTPNSFAFKNINVIADGQEECYKKITTELNIYPNFKLEYWLADTPQELGVLYGDDEPCNGFVRQPNKIFAVYNNDVKCVGMHEDAHIISFSVKKPSSVFISEGLAMYFDKQWQGRENEFICRDLLHLGNIPNVLSLIDNDKFFALNEEIAYPLSGSFTKFLVQKLTMKIYLKEIYYSDSAESYLNSLFDEGDVKEFLTWLELV